MNMNFVVILDENFHESLEQTKNCSKCGECKSLSEFHKNGSKGYYPSCKKCKNTITILYHKLNKDKTNCINRKSYHKNKNIPLKNKIYLDNKKLCARCLELKNLEDFNKTVRGNYYARCRICLSEHRKEKTFENRDEVNERRRNDYKNTLARYLYKGAKARAKRNGIEFNLLVSDVVIPEKCPILDIEFTIAKDNLDSSASIDRIDNTKGYVQGNIIVISYRANRIKSNSTQEERRLIYEFYRDLEVKSHPPYEDNGI